MSLHIPCFVHAGCYLVECCWCIRKKVKTHITHTYQWTAPLSLSDQLIGWSLTPCWGQGSPQPTQHHPHPNTTRLTFGDQIISNFTIQISVCIYPFKLLCAFILNRYHGGLSWVIPSFDSEAIKFTLWSELDDKWNLYRIYVDIKPWNWFYTFFTQVSGREISS